jgi:hypothetical protein
MLTITAYGIQQSKLKDTTDSRYKVGQVWSYWTRLQEKGSTFIVLKVEKHPTLHTIVHIALRGLKIRRPDGELIEEVRHAPFPETSLDSSGAKLVAEKAELPDYEADYRRWREAFDAGRGVVSADTIADTVRQIEIRLNRVPQSQGAQGKDKILSRGRPSILQMYHPATDRTEVITMLGSEGVGTLGTLVSPIGQSVTQASFQSGIVLNAAHYEYEGAIPSAGRDAWFTFITKKKDAFNELPPFTISVEGQTLYQGEAELSLNIYEINGSKYSDQWVNLRVSADVFLRAARAKNVEFKIGEKTYKPESFQQKYMHALANIIESQGK